MNTKTIMYSRDSIGDVVNSIMQIMHQFPIMTLTGPLGAGKTTIVQALLKACGIPTLIQSPTFTYVQTYVHLDGRSFHHFDLYRMQSLQQFKRIGFEEYLYQPDSWSIIEWPEIIQPLLRKSVCVITIDYNPLNAENRIITIQLPRN